MKNKIIWLITIVFLVVLIIATAVYGVWRVLATPSAPVTTPPAVYDLGSRAQFIRLDSPVPGDGLVSPLTVTGQARLWYFEASFPVELKDSNGKTLAVMPAQAQGDWMTEDFVPFKAVLVFSKPETATGTLTLKKDNPSGLPEFDDQVSVPVQFDLFNAAWTNGSSAPCRVGGCSGQLCTDQTDIVSTCEWRDEYACYKTASCARQQNGDCGWTQTQALTDCLAKARK